MLCEPLRCADRDRDRDLARMAITINVIGLQRT
jgi:hypothetical protein